MHLRECQILYALNWDGSKSKSMKQIIEERTGFSPRSGGPLYASFSRAMRSLQIKNAVERDGKLWRVTIHGKEMMTSMIGLGYFKEMISKTVGL